VLLQRVEAPAQGRHLLVKDVLIHCFTASFLQAGSAEDYVEDCSLRWLVLMQGKQIRRDLPH